MIKQLLFAVLMTLSIVGLGQSQLSADELVKKNYKEVKSDVKQSVTPDKYAMYPNGITGVKSFIFKTIVYPIRAMKGGKEGDVLVQFTVATNGDVTNVKVTKSLDPVLDEEAIKVVKKFKKWEPAYKDGKPVAIDYQVSCTFKKE